MMCIVVCCLTSIYLLVRCIRILLWVLWAQTWCLSCCTAWHVEALIYFVVVLDPQRFFRFSPTALGFIYLFPFMIKLRKLFRGVSILLQLLMEAQLSYLMTSDLVSKHFETSMFNSDDVSNTDRKQWRWRGLGAKRKNFLEVPWILILLFKVSWQDDCFENLVLLQLNSHSER